MSSTALRPGPAVGSSAGHVPLAFLTLFLVLAGLAVSSSLWLRAGPTERGFAAIERGDEAAIEALLQGAMRRPIPAGRVVPLVELALATGDTERALALLEDFVRREPGHVEGLRRLAEVLDQVRQNARRAVILERLHAAGGDIEHLRLASILHDSLGQRAERLRTIGRLIQLQEATAQEALIFAQAAGSDADRAVALQALLAALRQGAGDQAPTLTSLAAVLALDLPDAPARHAQLGEAAAGHPGALGMAANALLERGHPTAVRALFSRLSPALLDHPELIRQLVQAEMQTDRDSAYRRLARLQQARLLPAGLAADLVVMHAEAGGLETALRLAGDLPPEFMPAWLPGWLLERLAASGRLSLTTTIPPGPLAENPLFAAVAAIERQDTRAALPFARRAAEQPPEAPAQLALLADMLRRLELARPIRTAILDALRRGEGSPGRLALLPLLANGEASAALAALRPWRDRLPGAGVPWALLAAQQGQAREVLAWLPGATLPVQALLDIQTAALVRRDQALAEAAGQRVLRLLAEGGSLPAGWSEAEISLRGAFAGPLTEVALFNALDQLGSAPADRAERIGQLLAAHPDLSTATRWQDRVSAHPALARLTASPQTSFILGMLAPERATDLAERAAADPLRFGPLLVAARFRTGGEAAGKAALRDLLAQLPAANREAAIHVVIRYAPTSAAAIERAAAEAMGGNWAFNVLARLERAGQRGPLLAALRARAADASLPRNERMAAAARLAELQDREGAVAAMRALAEGQAPDSTEVRQLVYQWGPAARPEALSWAERRARDAPPAQRAAWLAHLDYLGGTAQALRLLSEWREALARDPALARTAATLFYRAGRNAQAEPVLSAAIQAAQDAAILGALGEAADAAALPRLALLAYGRALAQRPNETAWRIGAARAAASAHRPEEAAQHYRALIVAGRATPALLLEAGDALRATREASAARRLYSEALGLTTDERLRARLLARLGRVTEAEALLTRLLAATPNDPELRGELLELRLR